VSDYYKSQRARNLFVPGSGEPYKISRSGIDLFLQCPRCFYLDKRLGTGRVPMMPFNLNSAVDELLKREFDVHRAAGTAHTIMIEHGIDAIPFPHEMMDEWREARTAGARFLHEPTNLLVTGGVDDIWINPRKALHIVDYKATSKDAEVTLDAPWQIGYKRQVEVYQWLFRRNGFDVDPVAYFVYCNGRKNAPQFDFKLEFDVKVIPYTGDDSWVEPTLSDIKACLESSDIPAAADSCDWCAYRKAAVRHEA
jgi:hypothetical protein